MVVEASAKVTDEHEITPQSDYVKIQDHGQCVWQPRYELSASLCTIDVTWFPFDTQTCDLIFESWHLTDQELNLTIHPSRNIYKHYVPSDEWDLLCACN